MRTGLFVALTALLACACVDPIPGPSLRAPSERDPAMLRALELAAESWSEAGLRWDPLSTDPVCPLDWRLDALPCAVDVMVLLDPDLPTGGRAHLRDRWIAVWPTLGDWTLVKVLAHELGHVVFLLGHPDASLGPALMAATAWPATDVDLALIAERRAGPVYHKEDTHGNDAAE